ncbi:2-dehydro-3-deoxyphosphogluconate aldolase [Streptomyces mobaraensis NBRC 13819 = DSM 40847]|uniref:2-dehydro-3-deoxyphosphogluconate aldolase n=1 Tax=Streptomyces mobaraensis (strain ATCC 29032 / DSM 40847 / JCM 4168 / NBRC 13819 / NCIMB 11159 / IPCR 16-22) TaxID=1223523 RepID=M3C9Q6_STRM1|nr:2-dehydro-3-deoxy-phosphogluconate aldolase [Streptomyces mobaraensis]EMF00777.1 2-dehydro-3-deoxyphosphogluconate aldolase [Streptomyces mobaraensis NBRC 13819 = DSM 40847]QTT76338.1 2-dehydro-3-deoxyphosphogluconate aldolase [Streptomyces mobaraensis NBRC 13819 = DSM 40847]
MYRWEITRAALGQRVLAMVRGDSYDQATLTSGTLLSAGLTSLEISLATPFALDAVATLAREVGDEALIGAGTVLDAASARMAVEAGARFLASPALDPEVLRTGHRYGVPVFAGVSTPAEIVRALELGADALKLFPAAGHHPGRVREIRSELPQAALVPSGGVGVDTAPEWIAAGAVACGIGGALAEGDRDAVAKRVEDLIARLAEADGGEAASAGGAGETE